MTQRRSHPPAVIDQASAWVVRLGADDVSDADYEALATWLDQSPDHRPAFEEAQGLWATLEEDRGALDAALARSAPRSAGLKQASRPGVSRRWIWGAGGAVAAAVLCAVVLPPLLGPDIETYSTAPGQPRTITLVDGSTIAMNGGSTLSVRLSRSERLVEMGDAEAAFDVAHDANRPFRITVGESRVEVLGTAFDIRRDATSTRVSVTRGRVRVSDLADAARNVQLTVGQSVMRPDGADALTVVTGAADPAGWRSGQLVYQDRPLAEVIADLNRAYPTQVRAVGDVGDRRFTGVLVLDDQAAVLRRLEAFLPVVAERRGDVIELRPR